MKHAFDLACDPAVVAAALGPLAAAHPGLRVPGTFDGFELAARAVVGQQISVRAARTMLGRIARGIRRRVAAGRRASPDSIVSDCARASRRSRPTSSSAIGLTRARARTLIALAAAVASGEIRLEPGSDVDATLAALIALPGIGTWTANYIAMRALRWPDAFLASDLVVLKDDGRDQARARAARERIVAPLAFLRRHSPMEKRSMNIPVYFDRVTTPLGPMLLATDGVALIGAWFDGQRYFPSIDARWQPRQRCAGPAARDSDARRVFRREGARISTLRSRRRARRSSAPCGTGSSRCPTARRSPIAISPRASGSLRRVRAAGAATGRNPLSIFIPCHRIIGAGGALTGYAGGLDRKRALLALEREGVIAEAARRAA